MAIAVSAAGMVVQKKGGCVPDFVSYVYFLCMHCLQCHFRSKRKLGLQIYFCNGPSCECPVQIPVGYFLC